MSSKSISVVATAVLIAAATALVFRGAILGIGQVSLSLQAAGLVLVIWARLTFGLRSFHFAANPTQGRLVTNGPYRYLRNPIYAGGWLVIWTGVAIHWSPINGVLGAVVAVTLLIRIYCEEQLLRKSYPEYADYARNTARLIPFVV